MNTLHLFHRLNCELGEHGTVRQGLVLAALSLEAKPVKHRHLAMRLGITPPGLTRSCQTLEKRAFITRTRGGKKTDLGGDCRDKWISITPKGRALIEGAQNLERAA